MDTNIPDIGTESVSNNTPTLCCKFLAEECGCNWRLAIKCRDQLEHVLTCTTWRLVSENPWCHTPRWVFHPRELLNLWDAVRTTGRFWETRSTPVLRATSHRSALHRNDFFYSKPLHFFYESYWHYSVMMKGKIEFDITHSETCL